MDSKTLEAVSVDETIQNDSILTSENYIKDETSYDIPIGKDSDLEKNENTIADTQNLSQNESISENDLFSKSGKSYKNLAVFESIQKWKGFVTNIKDESFEARLSDLTNGGADEIAEFSIFDISENDRESLKIGKIFYWSIGRKEYLGQIEKTSRIRFQKVIKWDIDLVNKVKSKVDEYLKIPEAN